MVAGLQDLLDLVGLLESIHFISQSYIYRTVEYIIIDIILSRDVIEQ